MSAREFAIALLFGFAGLVCVLVLIALVLASVLEDARDTLRFRREFVEAQREDEAHGLAAFAQPAPVRRVREQPFFTRPPHRSTSCPDVEHSERVTWQAPSLAEELERTYAMPAARRAGR
jgi:hypothetical protein